MLLALLTSVDGELAFSLHNSRAEALAALALRLDEAGYPILPPAIDNIAKAAAAINEANLAISFSVAPALDVGQAVVCLTDGHAITADATSIWPIEDPRVMVLHGGSAKPEEKR